MKSLGFEDKRFEGLSFIGLDESFEFKCNQCGKCCINREDIILTPRDLFNISKELGMQPAEVVNKYCECYIGDNSRVPVVRLLPVGSIKRCPLLKNRKCSVHRVKPTVCAMFPVGRLMKSGEGEKPELMYIINEIDCGDKGETHTVREWLGRFGISLEDEFFMKWNSLIVKLSTTIREMESKIPEKTLQLLWNALGVILYLEFDTEKEFMEQFEVAEAKVLSLVDITKNMCK